MNNELQFKNLESLLKFLDRVQIEPVLGFRSYSRYYLLQAQMEIKIDNTTNIVYLCGTNHSTDPAEKLSIDAFLSNLKDKDKVLVEHGCGINSHTLNHIKAELKSRLNRKDEITIGLNTNSIFSAFAEIDYAADQATAKGASVINMDMVLNPNAISFMKDLYGTKDTIREVKASLHEFFNDKEALDKYVYELFSKAGVKIPYQSIHTERRRTSEEPVIPSNNHREHFMAQTILDEFGRNPLYVIAHTVHIKEIIKFLACNGDIISFSSKLVRTKDEHTGVGLSRKMVMIQHGEKYGQLILSAYDGINRVLQRFIYRNIVC